MLVVDRRGSRHRRTRMTRDFFSTGRDPSDGIARFRLALQRETEISSFWGRYLGLHGRLLDIPNGFARREVVLRFAPLLRQILPLAGVVWALVGLPLYVVVWAIRWSLADGWGERISLPSVFYLQASNDRNLAYLSDESGRPNVALTLPWWRGAKPAAWATTCIDLRQVSSRAAIWRAAWASVQAGFGILMSADNGSVLFTYSGPGWMWAHEVLDTAQPTQVWISNHVDRWASLVSSFPATRVVMVQHGDLAHWDARQSVRLVPRLSEPLAHVERVFVTDDVSIDDFIGAITGPGPEFSRISRGILVEAWPVTSSAVKRVLVIGHPGAHGAIGRVIVELAARSADRMKFAYRPHPTEARPVKLPLADVSSYVITATADTVPAADIILSYGSSVTGEVVRATGAVLVLWDPNDPDGVRDAVDAVLVAASSAQSSQTEPQA
jgi:hypothetical protein